jgi:hypothetical protein
MKRRPPPLRKTQPHNQIETIHIGAKMHISRNINTYIIFRAHISPSIDQLVDPLILHFDASEMEGRPSILSYAPHSIA